MRASSSEEDDSDTMFPTANEPAPARPNPTLSDLLVSPSPSQDPTDAINRGDDVMDFTGNANASIGENGSDQTTRLAGAAGGAGVNQKPLSKAGNSVNGEEAEKQPGYSWKNKKARDEYQRALEQVVDRNFNLSELCKSLRMIATANTGDLGEFGDPFDEREMPEEGTLGQ